MSISYIKKIKNEINEIERESDKFISSNKYYIIYLKFPIDQCENLSLEVTKKLGKIFLNNKPDHRPLCNYVLEDEIYLIFPPSDDHYLDGSYQKIISEYASFFSNYMKCSSVICKIIEFSSQIQIVTYFTLKTYLNSRKFIIKLSKDKISEEDISSKTLFELVEDLEKDGISWDGISNENKFGIFLKFKKQNEKLVISTLSECFDARNNEKYINYIFG